MSSPQRRRELQEQRERENEALEAEQQRVALLSVWERIEEAESLRDVKAILHILAERAGLE